jgi:dienelactone hydrolase
MDFRIFLNWSRLMRLIELVKFVFLMQTLIITVAFGFNDKKQTSITDLWDGFEQWDKNNPLNAEVIKEWDQGNGHFELIRYSLGKLQGDKKNAEPIVYTTQTNESLEMEGSPKTASPVIAAYYGYPKGKKHVPGIVHIHGGGQRANKEYVEYLVNSLSYAAISINWGGKVLEDQNTPNTDWDGLAAGFVGDKDQTHHDDQMPGKNTLYKEPHPLNSSWMLIAIASRRALTFLEQQPHVNPDKLGLTGHSMGGRATVLTAIDPRIKAAVPSVGGSGFLNDDLWGLPGSARNISPDVLPTYQRLIDCAAYWPLVKSPILFLGATNDFNSPTEWVIKGMNLLPNTTDSRLVLAPHLNHRFTSDTFAASVLWFEANLKNSFIFPKTARSSLILEQSDGIPLFKVYPDTETKLPLKQVDIYYSYGRDPRIRFWRDGFAKKVGDHWEARCPVFYIDEPLFAFANITYSLDHEIPLPAGYSRTISEVAFSSQYCLAYPDQLQKAGVKATEKTYRVIDDFSRGFHDWYTLSIDSTENWIFATRKIVDPSWVGPKNGKLTFEIDNPEAGNLLGVVAVNNEWIGYTGRPKDVYSTVVNLNQKGTVTVSLHASDFKSAKGQIMGDWDQITELNFRAADKALPDNKSLKPWRGKVPTLHNLRWEGGVYTARPKIHETKKDFNTFYESKDFNREFQKAIEDSVRLEKVEVNGK